MSTKLEDFANLLLEWNCIHNLGGNLDKALIENYILDSIYPLDFIQPFSKCMDIGSGAGFPAIPLAIKNPNQEFFLVEPRKKRSAFLQYICTEIGLCNVVVCKKRIQDMDKAIRVDLITSRALMATKELIKLSGHFLEQDGYFLFYKGVKLEDEICCDIKKYPHNDQRIYFYERKEFCDF